LIGWLTDWLIDGVVASHNPNRPLIVSGILAHEQKTSVLHFTVTRHASYQEPIRAKDELTFICGFRQMVTRPIYSEYSPNADKHKFERFFHTKRTSVASIYGPIMFPPQPVLIFRGSTFVGSGSLSQVDPNRIVLKRISLTGCAFKIHKRTTVVREMFYDPGM
jgi:pre-rRNA-processing protein TSR1